jgi:hypothetical protein
MGGNNNNNGNQGGRSNNYSGPNRKRKPDNTVAAIQCPAKDNSKKTSGGFKDLLKEKCPWHLDGNHTTEQCYQLRRALKDTPEPRHPHDKKGKKKADEDNDDFQEPDKTVNVLFGGLPNKWAQKATRREVMNIEPAMPTPLRCVGEFRKTRHPRNVEFNKVLKVCFSGAGNSRFSEAWNL